MQVSQHDFDTHAIIGGAKAQAFKVNETAEFFTMLSATLYKDKKRAVVREVICNAWDSHIASGIEQTPVEVVVTDTELVIRDFGAGIAPELVHSIYCVYGASTKSNDGTQTGGFGLGSKAPFAYSDHFSVTSCHKGVRTIFAISRGSSETAGVPDLRQVVSVPCTESGLTVTIPLRSASDAREFKQVIKDVVLEGGIRATLNGAMLERIEYERAELGFTGRGLIGSNFPQRSMVKYGAVVYPIETTEGQIHERLSVIERALNCAIILVAKPNSLGVTPSRESLSYTEKTIATLIELISRVERIVGEITKLDGRTITEYYRSLEEMPNNFVRPESFSPDEFAYSAAEYSRIRMFSGYWQNELAKKSPAPESIRTLLRSFSKQYGRRAIKQGYRPKKESYDHPLAVTSVFVRAKFMLRLASKIGQLDRLYYQKFGKLVSVRRGIEIWDLINGLIVGPTQRDILEHMRENEKLAKHFALVINRMSDEDRAEIQRLADHYKIEVKFLERAETKPKVSKARTPYYALWESGYSSHPNNRREIGKARVPYDENGRQRYKYEPILVAHPKYYVRCGRIGTDNRYSVYPQLSFVLPPNDIGKKLYPDATIVTNQAEERALQKLGALDLTKVVLEEFQKVSVNKRFLSYLSVELNFRKSELLVDFVLESDVSLLRKIYPEIPKGYDPDHRFRYLAKYMVSLRVYRCDSDTVPWIAVKCAESVRKESFDWSIRDRLPILGLLSWQVLETRCTTSEKDDLLDFIRYAVRRQKKETGK